MLSQNNSLSSRRSLRLLAVTLLSSIAIGSATAFFLWSLDLVTRFRWSYSWLLYFLPVAGGVVGLIYHRYGRASEGGNNLIIDEIHQPGGGIPKRMAPLVLFGTLVTHLCGGSAGREGTAVQMGGSIAAAIGRWCKIHSEELSLLLMTGVAAGFGAVFGTPWAGAIFAMEVLTVGKIRYQPIIFVLIASFAGHFTSLAWGIQHTAYPIRYAGLSLIELPLLAKIIPAAIVFGLAARFFSELAHGLQSRFKGYFPTAPFRPIAGGILVVAGALLLGTNDYLGLGVTAPHEGPVSIVAAFRPGGAWTWSWFWKILFTTVTVSSGFKGGEVTPLFFIGATLGNTLAILLNAPVELFAGLGFIAVFAGATNTPLACTVMGLELFGTRNGVYFGIACFVAYFCSGHSGIYLSQKLDRLKHFKKLPAPISLRERRHKK